MSFAPGALIGGRFRLTEMIGRGGMGEVWGATDTQSNLPVALKTLRTHALRNPHIVARFAREADVMRILSDVEFIPTLHAAGTDPQPYIVLERMFGQTLEDVLRQERTVALTELHGIIEQVLVALVAAHERGVVHRDLKPENVFLAIVQPNTPPSVRVIDFGVSKIVDDGSEGLTTDGATLGTMGYAAPEQLGDPSGVDGRADVYAVGAIVFRALAGHLPFSDRVALYGLKRDFEAPSLDEATGKKWGMYADFTQRTLARDPPNRLTALEALEAWRGATGTRDVRGAPSTDSDPTATMTRVPRKK